MNVKNVQDSIHEFLSVKIRQVNADFKIQELEILSSFDSLEYKALVMIGNDAKRGREWSIHFGQVLFYGGKNLSFAIDKTGTEKIVFEVYRSIKLNHGNDETLEEKLIKMIDLEVTKLAEKELLDE